MTNATNGKVKYKYIEYLKYINYVYNILLLWVEGVGGGSYVFKLTMLYGIPVAVLKAGISLSANSLAVTIIRRCLEGKRGADIGERREVGTFIK